MKFGVFGRIILTISALTLSASTGLANDEIYDKAINAYMNTLNTLAG